MNRNVLCNFVKGWQIKIRMLYSSVRRVLKKKKEMFLSSFMKVWPIKMRMFYKAL